MVQAGKKNTKFFYIAFVKIEKLKLPMPDKHNLQLSFQKTWKNKYSYLQSM